MPDSWELLPLFARPGVDVVTVLLVSVCCEPSALVIVLTSVIVDTSSDAEDSGPSVTELDSPDDVVDDAGTSADVLEGKSWDDEELCAGGFVEDEVGVCCIEVELTVGVELVEAGSLDVVVSAAGAEEEVLVTAASDSVSSSCLR
jgi:hypothetical protein